MCYGTIAVALWRARAPFYLWLGFTVLEIPYSLWSGRLKAPVDLAMLELGLLACIEALRKARASSYALIAAVSIAAIPVLITATEIPHGKLFARHLAIIGSFVLFAVIALLDWVRPFEWNRQVRAHIRLLTAWLGARTASTLAYDWYDSPEAWRLAGWLFLAALAAIACGYVVSFSGRAAPQVFRPRP